LLLRKIALYAYHSSGKQACSMISRESPIGALVYVDGAVRGETKKDPEFTVLDNARFRKEACVARAFEIVFHVLIVEWGCWPGTWSRAWSALEVEDRGELRVHGNGVFWRAGTGCLLPFCRSIDLGAQALNVRNYEENI